MNSQSLRFTSSQAPNANPVVQAILEYLGTHLNIKIEWMENKDWLLREEALDKGDNHFGWVCGLPYVWKTDDPEIDIELLAAPVMSGERYKSKPIYYSDVIVKKESAFHKFHDLRGASWGINERRSHSGFNITRFHLASISEDARFFREVKEMGSHQIALRKVIRGRIDASAIDSTVLETELRIHPEFLDKIKIIETFGPSPIPPWIIHKSVDNSLIAQLREQLLNLHNSPEGRMILDKGKYSHFTAVEDSDYDLIREMEKKGSTIKLL